MKGKYVRTKEIREKISKTLRGRRISPATEFKKGKEHPNYNKGSNGWNYKCGYSINKKGHKILHINGKHILESHLVWINHNQFRIPEGYCIHHKDLNPSNNDINNLVMLPSGYHNSMHGQLNHPKGSKFGNYGGII